MLPESAKKLREPIAAVLLGATVLYLIVAFTQLFKDVTIFDEPSFSDRAYVLQDAFVSPVWVLVVVFAAWLAASSDRGSSLQRILVIVAASVLALMALLGIITWLASLGADIDSEAEFFFGGGKLAHSFYMIAALAVLTAGLLLVYSLFRSLPARARKTPQQQWGGQPQWGGQQQWGGQPPPAGADWGTQGSAQPQPGYAAGGATAVGASERPSSPTPSQPPAQSWGQPAGQQPSWGQPQPPGQPQPAPQPPPEHRRPSEPPPTGERPPAPPPQAAAPPQAQRRDDEDDDSRSSWWNPGS